MYTRRVENSDIKAIKVKCALEATLSQLTAVLLDIPARHEWIYATKFCRAQKNIPRYNTMAINPYYYKVVSEQVRGFVPKALSDASLQSLLLLEEGLQALEAACSAIDPPALNTILTWRYAHSDMFMEDVLADQIKRGTISRYPVGWADDSRDYPLIGDHVVDEKSPFSLWAVYPFTIVVRELEHYPLLGFRSAGAYVTFMLLLRDRRFEEAILCLNGSARRAEGDENERKIFNGLFQDPVPAADFRLMLFLLYRALWSSLGGEKRGSELRDTWGDRLISSIRFPAGLPAENWYGELLMKVRRFMKKQDRESILRGIETLRDDC